MPLTSSRLVTCLAASCLLLTNSCYVSVTGFGGERSFDMDTNAQIKFLENTKKQALAYREVARSSLRGRICSVAEVPAESVDTVKLATEIRRSVVDWAIQFATSKQINKFYNAENVQAGFAINAIDPSYLALVRDLSLEIKPSESPSASATETDNISPTILISSGLVKRLCEETSSNEMHIALMHRIDNRLNEIKRGDIEDSSDLFHESDAIFKTTGPLMDMGFNIYAIQHFEIDFLSALLFIVGHELSHAIFDTPSRAGFSSFDREFRADFFGYFVTEAGVGAGAAKKKTNKSLRNTLQWSASSVSNGILVTSTEGYKTTLELVYGKVGMTEGNEDHPPMSERLMALNRFNDLATNSF